MNSKSRTISYTPLHLLSRETGNLEVAELLLEHDADPNILTVFFGDGPLSTALQKDRPGLVQLLLKHGADPNARGNNGQTPLHAVSLRRDWPVKAIQGLLELGADVNSQDNKGTTPLQVASRYGKKHIVQLLLQHGAEGT